MADLTIPRLNSNDETYVLVGWLVQDGQQVTAGEPVAQVETSKALEDLVAEVDGYLRHHLAEGSTCQPGGVIGRVCADRAEWQGASGPRPASGHRPAGPLVTQSARDLLD